MVELVKHGVTMVFLEKAEVNKDSTEICPFLRVRFIIFGYQRIKMLRYPDFDENTQVNNDVTVYALWKRKLP